MPTSDEAQLGRAALQRALDRLRAAAGDWDQFTGPPAPLSEALHWMYACDQWLQRIRKDSAYTALRSNPQHADHETLDGLLLARGRLTHQLAIGGVVMLYGGRRHVHGWRVPGRWRRAEVDLAAHAAP